MGDVHLVIDGAKMAELLSAAGPVGQHLITRAEQFKVTAHAQAAKNRRTGCMDGSILKRPVVDTGGDAFDHGHIGHLALFAGSQELFAVRPRGHETPRHSKRLRMGDQLRHRREPTTSLVSLHPGNKANRFLSDNLAIFVMA